MFQKIFLKLWLLQVPYQMDLVGSGLVVVGLVPILVRQKSSTFSEAILILAGIAFAAGFAYWFLPQLRKVWGFPLGKLAVMLLHGLILLLSAILARFLVAEALRLPPQDFDMTVGIWTLVLYLPVWLFVIAFLTFLFYAIALVCFLVFIICEQIVGIAADFLSALQLLHAASCALVSFRRRLLGLGNKVFGHAIGAAAVSLIAMYIWAWFFAGIRSLGPLIRWVAYCADFQEASLYPGVEAKRRFRLHENGVVSYAERQGCDISISVEKVQ